MSIAIRLAQSSDIANIVRLYQDAQSIHARLAPGTFREAVPAAAVAKFWTHMIVENMNVVLVANFDEVLCGYAWATLQERPPTLFTLPSRTIYVQQIVVERAFRRRGIGSRLLSEIDAYAEHEGAEHIVLDSLPSNEEAQMFYERAGYSPVNMRLAKTVPTP